ncbi:MAG: hypothetical protein IT179_14145 [Acidobacteria bacterium]|nr:hypothetical protein [Acidobacteriota bacterium]
MLMIVAAGSGSFAPKAVALALVLIVSIGPGAALLCRAWCDQHLAAVTGCHDAGRGDDLRVTTDTECADLVLAAPSLAPEDTRRNGPPASHVQTGRASAIGASSLDRLPPLTATSGHPPRKPPLSLNLRI